MTQKNTAEKPVEAKQGADVPANLPLELVPAYLWWKANGNQILMNVVVALVVAGAALGGYKWWQDRGMAANREFAQAQSFEELEAVVAKYGSTSVGNATRLRLAKAYFDASRYEDALQTYETCLKKGAPNGFAEVAQLGGAHSLEALGNLDEAFAAYSGFAEKNPKHFLAAQARMGMARILTLQGKKDEAKQLLELLKAEKTGEPMVEAMVAQLEDVIGRYEPRAARSLFDRANEAAMPVVPATETASP